MFRSGLIILALLTHTAIANAYDVVCTSETSASFGIKFKNSELLDAVSIESETRTVLTKNLVTVRDDKEIYVGADLGRSGKVEISLVEYAGKYPEYRLFTGEALINIFNEKEINTNGPVKVECYAKTEQ